MTFAQKLESLLIGEVEFRDVSLAEAVEFLRFEAHRVDEDESDVYRRGVPIGVLLPPGAAHNIRVSLAFHDANLASGLFDLAVASGLALLCTETGAYLAPASALFAVGVPRPDAVSQNR